MKKQILICLFLMSFTLITNAQILYLPNGEGGIGNSNTNSNIGIGTDSPEKKIQINAVNTDAGLRLHALTSNNNTNTPYLLLTGGYKPNNGVALRGVGDKVYGRKALVFYSGWDEDTDDPQITDLRERMRISSSGFIGIGTDSPEKKIQINAVNTDAGLRLHALTGDNNTNTPYLLLTGGYKPNNGVALRGVGDKVDGRKALVFYSGWDGEY